MNHRVFTVRVKPYQDESLSSYLYRLASFNGTKMLQLWNSLKVNYTAHYAQWNDINLIDSAPINTINVKRLSEYVNVSEGVLLDCTLYNVQRLFCGSKEIERSRLLSGIIRENLHYCPKCFEEKKYNRLLWRIDHINGCIKHGDKLLQKCSFCNEEIKYKDISVIGECPYCENSLCDSRISQRIDEENLENESWYSATWEYLINNHDTPIQTYEVALRILFLLNNQKEHLDLNVIENNMRRPGSLPTLLQHARQSLAHERALHITFLLSVLKDNEIGLRGFLKLELPNIFREAINYKKKLLKDELFCLAPWCASYKKSGSLMKTGKSLKRRASGNILKYYLVCNTCGCEYAINEEDQLEERTYFIEAFNKLNEQVFEKPSLNELVLKTGLTTDKVRRSMAYFRSRSAFQDLDYQNGFVINEDLLSQFIKAIDKGETIKVISNWDLWGNINDYLSYRYHIRVIQTLNKKDVKVIEIKPDKKHEIIELLKCMYEQDEEISLKTVCEKLGVCAETIRYWGCNKVISKMKEKQKVKSILEKKTLIYSKVDDFLLNNINTKLSAAEIYKHIEFQRTVLWRVAPEITAYIGRRRMDHNQKLKVSGEEL
ncbi:TniQ family protein [Paenibacillus sedimenti]|uniref:TniQ family protein n=1 Tax=Paenibacillus sedimenti TaxID=2770274 RepID=A0A926KVX9_9BACL|nr:TniQ family protein [Paenibacillus sedimenti]MBD0383871.1 TniQ family protein [Paenibacillus sedimenti]